MEAATTKDQRGSRAGRRWVIPAAVLIIVVAAAYALLRPGGDDAAMATDANGIPVVVHESVAALQSGDYDAWRELRSPDAELSDGHPVVENSPLRRLFARQAEVGLELSVLACQEDPSSSHGLRTYTCSIEGSEAMMRAAGIDGHATWTYTIDGAFITESSPPFFDNSADIAQVHGALARYLRDVDRSTFQQVCNGGTLDLFDASLGSECTAFVLGHLEGFEATVAAPGS